jgi:predicted DNA-binding protein YlxM (UPF0122 family)
MLDSRGEMPIINPAQRGSLECLQEKVTTTVDDEVRFEQRIRINALYDLYSPLLTERQRDVYTMRCFLDLSLAEVAETLGVTRQAVHILANRTEEKLLDLEKTLGLAARIERLQNRIKELEPRSETPQAACGNQSAKTAETALKKN